MTFAALGRELLDWIFPSRCGLCGQIGQPAICQECRKEFVPSSELTRHNETPLEVVAAPFGYEGRASQAVRRLKFARATSLARPMSCELARFCLQLPNFDAVVPVPIHWSRRAGRGFNQAELLAEFLEIAPLRPGWLTRIRRTRPQVGLHRSERLRNLQGAFAAQPEVARRRILLVDDVITTGGTARACAEALFQQGADAVGLLAFCSSDSS